jgi:hypothetical protein
MDSSMRVIDVVRWLGCAAAIVLLALFVAARNPATASAAGVSCGEAVIEDWAANGVVDRTYASDCYASALRELPEDARIYSSAASDILAARARAGLRANSNRSLQSAKAAPTTRADTVGGSSFSATALSATAAAAGAVVSAIFLRRRKRGKRAELPSGSERL